MIHILLLLLLLFKKSEESLCIYNSHGKIIFNKLNIEDIDYAYSKVEFFFDNPFNTFFGNCTDEENVVNIYGIPAKRMVANKDSKKVKRDGNKIFDKLELKKGRKCNILTSKSAEANPYHEDLTGMSKPPNFIKGWKYMDYTNKYLAEGGSTTITYSVSLDESYSISVQDSTTSSESLTIENHSEDISNKNFSRTISEIIEEALSSTHSEDVQSNWEESVSNEIVKANEKHTERNANKETNDNTTTGSFSNSDSGSNSSSGSSSGSDSGASSDVTNGFNGGFNIGIPGIISLDLGGDHSETEGKSKSKRNDKNRERGRTRNRSTGTSTDHTVGKSESTGTSSGESDSVSEAESNAKTNGGSKSTSNAVERSRSTSRGEDNTESTEIGHTVGRSDSVTTSTEKLNSKTFDYTRSQSISYSIADTVVNNGNSPCNILLYKKIVRNIQIVSCYDYYEEIDDTVNTRSIVNIDIDDKALKSIGSKMLNVDLFKNEDYHSLLLDCKTNTDEYEFLPEASEFTSIFKDMRPSAPSVVTHDHYLESGQKLESIKNLGGDNTKKHQLELTITDGNLVLKKDDVLYLNTNTTYAKCGDKTYFRISPLNHLEVYTDDEMFGPIYNDTNPTYAYEFKDVNYMKNPDLPDINDTKPNPDDNPKEPNKNEQLISHLKDDDINVEFIFSKSEEECRDILWYCNCLNPKNPINPSNSVCTKTMVKIKTDVLGFRDFLKMLRSNNICMDKNKYQNYNYSNDEIDKICNKDTKDNGKISDNGNQEEVEKNSYDCSKKDQCSVFKNSQIEGHFQQYTKLNCDAILNHCRDITNSIDKMEKKEGELQKVNQNPNNDKSKESITSYFVPEEVKKRIENYVKEITDKSKFKVKETVLWSNIKPEHQHLTVGWNGNGLDQNPDTSYLIISAYDPNKPYSTYDGLTLYDHLGIPIWRYKTSGNVDDLENKSHLDPEGYYLPVKYGYPFLNEEVTKNIPHNYLYYNLRGKYFKKNVPHLQLPDNIHYKEKNFLYFGGCHNTLNSNEGIQSESGRFKLILKDNGNLIFKDNFVTIWESKTGNLWQGKGPYKLIIGSDGVMRILNKYDYVLMSTINSKEPFNKHIYRTYRLEVLNAGTFRIVNEYGEEVWNMWGHTPNHEFYIYNEIEFYNACEAEDRNPNLPLITTYKVSDNESPISNFDNSVIRVGEQLINRFTESQYDELRKSDEYKFLENENKKLNLDSTNEDYIYDENDNFYSTARMPLTGFHLEYQNILQKFEKVDDEDILINDRFIDLKPITDRNSRIVYGKLNNKGTFNIYDCKEHILFSTGIEDEECSDSQKCFYFMYITPDANGYIKIMKRKYKDEKNKSDYLDSLIWVFPPNKKLKEMRSDNEKHFLKNLESLIYRNENAIDKDCQEKEKKIKEDSIKAIQKYNINYTFISQQTEDYCRDALWYCKCRTEADSNKCRSENVKIKSKSEDYEKFKQELKINNVYDKTMKYDFTEVDINNVCQKKQKDCSIINEFPCMTLRSKGVYFYGESKPYFPYDITTESKLYLDSKDGYLKLDGQNVLDLEDEDLPPTTLRCTIENDKYGIELISSTDSTVIWEYPSKIYYNITNDPRNNSIMVDRSIYYLNDKKENVPCLEFKSDGLYNADTKIVQFKNETAKGRTLYLEATKFYIQDIDDHEIEDSVINLYNPKKHNVELHCENENTIVITDQITKNVIWSYPSQQYTLLSSDTDTNELRPSQQLIAKGDENKGRFCLKIDKDNLINSDPSMPKLLDTTMIKPIDDKDYIETNIEYLYVTKNGVFIRYGNGTIVDVIETYNKEKIEIDINDTGNGIGNDEGNDTGNGTATVTGHDTSSTTTTTTSATTTTATGNETDTGNGNGHDDTNKKSVYSIRCEEVYGRLKASIYHNNELVMTLPKYIKNYEISSTNHLYYGEKLYKKGGSSDEACLTFNDNKLYTVNNNKNFTIKNNIKFNNKNYINIKDRSIYLNDKEEIDKVKDISNDVELKGICMDYHGKNKFVLYSPEKNIVYKEYPPLEKKTILQGDDVIYDMLYVDDKFKKPCIRIEELLDKEGLPIRDGNGKKIGLFFNTKTDPIPLSNEPFYDIPDNNNLRFNQEDGTLLLNGKSIFSENFSSSNKNLVLKCKYEHGSNLYAAIENDEGKEIWRYPNMTNRTSLSTEATVWDEASESYIKDFILADEWLYTDNNEKCFKVTKKGIQFNHNNFTYYENGSGKAEVNNIVYLQIDKEERDAENSNFSINFFKTGGDKTAHPITIPNRSHAKSAELKCDLNYGYYVIDSNKNRLKSMVPKTYDDENLFTHKKILYVGDKIVSSKDGTVCAQIDENFKFLGYDNVYSIQLNIDNMASPLNINGFSVFENIPEYYKKNPPKSISLRCHIEKSDMYIVLYDDDTNTPIDEILKNCRKHEEYISNEKNNNSICLGELKDKNSLGEQNKKCMSYIKSKDKTKSNIEIYEVVDVNNQQIFESPYKSDKIVLDIETGNLVVSDGVSPKTLLSTNRKNVAMKCGNSDEILLLDKEDNDKVLWKYRPDAEIKCANGVELNSDRNFCTTIYKYEKMDQFKIDPVLFKRFYSDDILQLSIKNNGTVVANEKEILIEDEWNLGRNFNYAIKCTDDGYKMQPFKNNKTPECKFMNLNTKEVIQNFSRDTIRNTISSNDIFYMGHSIMCEKAGLVLTNNGYIYRSIDDDNNKTETLFKGEIEKYAIGDKQSIGYGEFDENYNFVIKYIDSGNNQSFSEGSIIVPYEDRFEEDDSDKKAGFPFKQNISKDVGLTCKEGRLQFYETRKGVTKIYYEYPMRSPENPKRVYIYEKESKRCIYVDQRNDKYPLRVNSLCDGELFQWEIPDSGRGIWKNVGSNRYITSGEKGLVYTTSDITESIGMSDVNKVNLENSYSLGCYHIVNPVNYEADSTMKNDQCGRYGDVNRWVVSETKPIKTMKVYVMNSVTKGCLYAKGKASNTVMIDRTCKGEDYLWEVPESGNGVWKNVGTGLYLKKSSDNKLMLTSYFYDAGVLNMGDITSSEFGVWIDGYENNCLYPTNELQACDANNSKHKWIISTERPAPSEVQKVYLVYNKKPKGCLKVSNSGDLLVSITEKCNGDEFIWEIPKSGNAVLRNVGTKMYLAKDSNNKLTVVSDLSDPKIAMVSKNEKFGISISDHGDECFYVNDKLQLVYQNCDEANERHKWLISYKKPDIYDLYKFKSLFDKGKGEYLSVSSISNYDRIRLSKSNKYYSWILSSMDKPEYWYLANAENGGYGQKSDYCLDVNLSESSKYERRLMLVKCDKAKAKFKYGGHYPRNIYVHYKDRRGKSKVQCIDFGDVNDSYSKVRDCQDSSPSGNTSFAWSAKSIDPIIHCYSEN